MKIIRMDSEIRQVTNDKMSDNNISKNFEEKKERKYEFTTKEQVLIMLPLLIGGFIALLNETILNVAFPQLMVKLNVSLSTIQWLGTAYMLVIGILVPTTAFLIKTFSTKKLYLSAMVLFTIGTLMCGFANSFSFLLVSRILQGAGTGLLLPIMMDTIMEIFPPSKRGAAMGISMMVVVAAPGIGPTLSGFILQYMDWHWLFFMMLPFAALAITLSLLFLKSFSKITKPRIDVLSIFLSVIGFGGLIFGISSIESIGFLSMPVLISLACGIIGLFIFSKRQFTLKQPMLVLDIFRHRMFTLGTIVLFVAFMMPFAINIILPTYMINVMGVSTITAGLALLPGSLVSIVVAPISGKLFDKIGAKPLLLAGFLALVVSMFLLSHTSQATVLNTLIALQVLMTLGIGLIITPAQTNSLNHIPKKNMPSGVAILNTTQQIAAAFGSSLFIGLMGAVHAQQLEKINNPSILQQNIATINGANAAFTSALILVLIGFILTFFIKRRQNSIEPK